ncbi:CubicO group peptidase, beta-lactamase class C family [Sunxiuqinia elliptica]|uniref:CubicO group peptidase, beta-lactamase class C family n=2 Tax=Sunxiuqinia elliptica TaxID=655355 RepID=A0A1I2HUP1_9BACT|nr:CubicO group peptidase, beta-lactamase class C family [Sunxiuqinia elliptica]
MKFFSLIILLITTLAHSQNKSKLESYMDAQANINGFSGTVLITKSDSVMLKRAYGLADYEWKTPNTIDTKFSLASVSKQFTAVAILQLVEKGQMSLDDKLVKYYPQFPHGDQITIQMMLTHNAGFQMDYDELYLAKTALEKDSVASYIMQKPLLFEPGSKTAYSNIGYYLLARIIEKVSHQAYATYLKLNLFDVAQMYNTGISNNDSIVARYAKTYYRKDNVLIKNPYINWNYNIGHDGVYSTVGDLYLWNKALFDSTILLNAASKKKMFTSYNDEKFGFGLLINPFYNQNHQLMAHDGGFFGAMSSFNKFTDDDIFITVLSNNQSPSYLIAYALAAIVFDKPVELPYKHVQVKIDTKVYEAYIGQYEDITILKKNEKLYYSSYDSELLPASNEQFFRSDNRHLTIEFVRNSSGIVTALKLIKAGVIAIKKKTD